MTYLFLRGKHSLGRSPGDFGVLRSDGWSKLQALRSRGGGMGLTFLVVVVLVVVVLPPPLVFVVVVMV